MTMLTVENSETAIPACNLPGRLKFAMLNATVSYTRHLIVSLRRPERTTRTCENISVVHRERTSRLDTRQRAADESLWLPWMSAGSDDGQLVSGQFGSSGPTQQYWVSSDHVSREQTRHPPPHPRHPPRQRVISNCSLFHASTIRILYQLACCSVHNWMSSTLPNDTSSSNNVVNHCKSDSWFISRRCLSTV